MCYAVETRPYNQGSRLTAHDWCMKIYPNADRDNMAAFLMQKDEVDAIIVGDRVAKNGDTANKIGTYSWRFQQNITTCRSSLPLPPTTLDASISGGMLIEIEERPGGGVRVQRRTGSRRRINVWNPAFDITPAWLIEGIVTERTCLYKNKRGERIKPAGV